ncbi:zinc-finger protein [Ceratobasidium sp. 394]|nr:zinc-finger protein [Ceratobasidium sp. 394]
MAGVTERELPPCSSAVIFCRDSACLPSGFSSSCCSWAPPESTGRPSESSSEMDLIESKRKPSLLSARRLYTTRTQRHALQGPFSALPDPSLGFYTASVPQGPALPGYPPSLISGHWPLGSCPPDCQEPCTLGCEDLTEQCTPDCVQVAVPCLDSCAIPANDCNPETCPDSTAEHIVWAAPEWHAHCNTLPQFAMDNKLGEDLQQLFDCCSNTYYPQNDCCIPLPAPDGSTVNVTQQAAHEAGLAALFKSYHPASPTSHSLSPQSLSTAPTPELSSLDYFPHAPSTSTPSTSATVFTCQWSNCGQSFPSLNELVGHVNLAHLRFPPSDTHHDHAHGAPACHIAPPQSSPLLQPTPQDTFSCPWSNCSVIPAPMDATADLNASLCALASHLFYDHLRLPTQDLGVDDSFSLQSPVTTNPIDPSPISPTLPSLSASTPSLAPAPARANPNKGKKKDTGDPAAPNTHTCGWTDCNQTFETSADLTEHLSNVHVGRGKASYDCHWVGCARHGPKHGFSSKQKVLRHLQSHTGHRPFKCDVCGLDFSEAATLQQHMRRHTQESNAYGEL